MYITNFPSKLPDPKAIILVLLLLPALGFGELNREGKSVDDAFNFLSRFFAPFPKENSTTSTALKVDDRGLVKEAVIFLESRFRELMLNLPSNVDLAVSTITESILKTNLVATTITVSFFLAAALDTGADYVKEERSIQEVMTTLEPWLLYGYLWGYGIGFAGPFFIGLEDHNQDCSSDDLLQIFTEHNLDLSTIYNLTSTQIYLLSRSIRSNVDLRLFCIITKTDRFKEAAFVDDNIVELLDISRLLNQLNSFSPSAGVTSSNASAVEIYDLATSIKECDLILSNLWNNFEQQVITAYEYSYAARVNENIIKVVIGVPNFIAMVCGVTTALVSIDLNNLPALADIPGVLVNKFTSAVTEGRASNAFFGGDVLSVLGYASWGYGYYAPYFKSLEEPDPGCGLIEFHDIIRSYRELENFTETYGTGFEVASGAASVNAFTFPSMATYRIKRFGRELKTGLHCLLTRTEKPSNELLVSLDTWLDVALYRMEQTAALYSLLGRNI